MSILDLQTLEVPAVEAELPNSTASWNC
ncbi:SapB/AmfS family lanthipeptide [Saccharomonospora sp. NB11]